MSKKISDIRHELVRCAGTAPLIVKSLEGSKHEERDLFALEDIGTKILKLVSDYRDAAQLENR